MYNAHALARRTFFNNSSINWYCLLIIKTLLLLKWKSPFVTQDNDCPHVFAVLILTFGDKQLQVKGLPA